MSIVSWRIANFGTLGSILGALGDHLAPFEEPGVWLASGSAGWLAGLAGWLAPESREPTQERVKY